MERKNERRDFMGMLAEFGRHYAHWVHQNSVVITLAILAAIVLKQAANSFGWSFGGTVGQTVKCSVYSAEVLAMLSLLVVVRVRRKRDPLPRAPSKSELGADLGAACASPPDAHNYREVAEKNLPQLLEKGYEHFKWTSKLSKAERADIYEAWHAAHDTFATLLLRKNAYSGLPAEVGYLSMFPLKNESAADYLRGSRSHFDMRKGDIPAPGESSNYVFIQALALDSDARSRLDIAIRVLVMRLRDYLGADGSLRPVVIAEAATRRGHRLLERCGFTARETASKSGNTIFELDLGRIDEINPRNQREFLKRLLNGALAHPWRFDRGSPPNLRMPDRSPSRSKAA